MLYLQDRPWSPSSAALNACAPAALDLPLGSQPGYYCSFRFLAEPVAEGSSSQAEPLR